MYISKIVAKQTHNANNIGSINATIKDSLQNNIVENNYTNKSAVSKTNIDSANANIVNNLLESKISDIRNIGVQKNNSLTHIQKQPLYQKYHGMPGVGVYGTTGLTGDKGNYIYFGYIDDFFEGVYINIGNLIYAISERADLGSASDKLFYEKYIATKFTNSTYKNILNNIQNDTTYFYNGAYIETNNVKYDAANEDQLMYNMLASLKNESLIKPYNLSSKEVPSYTNTDDVSKYNIKSDATFNDNPVNINNNNITWEDSDAIANALKVGSVTTAYPASILNDSKYSNFYESDGNYNYVKETINNSYITGPTQYYAEVSPSANSIKLKDGTYVSLDDVYYYIKMAFNLFNNSSETSLFDGVLTMSNVGLFGLGYDKLFTIDTKNNNLKLRSADEILSIDNYNQQLKDFISKYYNTLLNYIQNLNDASTNESFSANVVYSDYNDAKLFIPLSLSTNYKSGDTLYFYTGENSADDVNIEYVVYLTDEMAGCSKENLIKYAQQTDPFTINRLNKNNKRIQCLNNAALIKNYADSSADKFFNKSSINIIDNYTDSTFIIANADTDNKNFVNFISSNYDDDSSLKFTVYNNELHISSNNPVKLDNLYINIDDLTNNFNGELKSYIYNSNIIFDDGAFIHPLDNIMSYINQDDNQAYAAGTVYCEQYFKNFGLDDNKKAIPLDDYIYGYDLYDSNFKLIKSQYSTSYRLDINFALETNILDPVYYVQIYVSAKNGVKFTSRISKITADFHLTEKINKTYNSPIYRRFRNNPSTFEIRILQKLKIKVLGSNEEFIPNNIGNKILYDISNINANADWYDLKLYSEDSSLQIIDVLFNHKNVDGSINSWASVSSEDISTYKIYFESNLPNNAESIDDYAITYCDKDTTNSDCELFKRLIDNVEKDSCKSRSINVTIAYKDSEDSYIKYQNFDITQPGFTDTRDCPSVSLNMHYGITDTQQYNTVEHGVLCNQFITYMDINIENFKETWGQFENDNYEVSMDLLLQNINSDIDWQAQNLINTNIIPRPTVKLLVTNEDIADPSNNMENYIKLNVVPFETYNNLTSLTNNVLQNTENVSIDTSTYLIINEHIKSVNANVLNLDSSDYIDQYIILDSPTIKSMKDAVYIYNGIQKDFNININDIKLDDYSNNTLKLKVLFEMGNPILANLYLRFAVTKVVIKLTDKTSRQTKTTFTATLSTEKDKSSYLQPYNSPYDYTYRFLSDKLDVMINPLSYTVCPSDTETSYSAMSGNIEKYGMPIEILKSLRFYNSDIYEYSNLMNVTSKQAREQYKFNWSSILLKKRYLQDNIKNIIAQPISLSDILGDDFKVPHIDPYNAFIYDNDLYNDATSGYYLDSLAGDKYLAVIYNGALMNPKYRDDNYSFIYNGETLELDRYSQLANNYPAWVSDECSIEMRSDTLINSMDVWNDEYNFVSTSMSDTNILFKGILSLYGNGYNYLPNSYDDGQYTDAGEYTAEQLELNSINKQLNIINNANTTSETLNSLKESLELRAQILENTISQQIANNENQISDSKYKDVLSLSDTKAENDVYIYNAVNYDRIYGSATTKYEPEVYKYFRSFLYDINWIYPKYTNDSKVTPYRLVSGFDYLMKISEQLQSEYPDKWSKLNGSVDEITNMIPYNLLYTVYPRVAYNDEKDTLNCLMLRRPTIWSDSDINSFDKCYILNNRYFKTKDEDEIKHIGNTYIVK